MLSKEIERLKKRLLELSALAEDLVRRAVLAVEKRDVELARAVIDEDSRIDVAEVEIEEECLKVLALHQPVAIDLRHIIAVLKINNDLERIGDLAVNIAKRVRHLGIGRDAAMPAELHEMANKVHEMLRTSLDALVAFDGEKARRVLGMDSEVDAMHRGMFRQFDSILREDSERAVGFVNYVTVSRNLERVADLATNIAEDTIYLVDGDIVRHQHDADS